jgi:hypothetical protein
MGEREGVIGRDMGERDGVIGRDMGEREGVSVGTWVKERE